MKKVVFPIALFLAAVLVLSSCSKSQKQTLKIALEENAAPYCYYNEKGELEGFYVRALRQIARDSGFGEVSFVPCRFEELQEKLESGEIDCYAAKGSEDREKTVKSESFFHSGCAFLVDSDSEYFGKTTSKEIIEAKTCCLKNGVQADCLGPENVTALDSFSDVETALNEGEYDVFAGDYFLARAMRPILTQPFAFKQYHDSQLSGEHSCHRIFFAEGSAQLCEKLEKGIEKFSIDDATKIMEKQIKIFCEINIEKSVEK
ncbi:MAG: transporter substrate-binding domain-containing protein [Clostridia bacterium]|nr:transporter substrate-binding domain-containing protein [Clostridia bacterium]